jgi:hypothetical protein
MHEHLNAPVIVGEALEGHSMSDLGWWESWSKYMNELGKLTLVKEEEKETNVVALQIITGGKGPNDPENWLEGLEVGTTFLAYIKPTANKPVGPELMPYTIMYKASNSIKLQLALPDGTIIEQWFKPLEFCRAMVKHEVLQTAMEMTYEE